MNNVGNVNAKNDASRTLWQHQQQKDILVKLIYIPKFDFFAAAHQKKKEKTEETDFWNKTNYNKTIKDKIIIKLKKKKKNELQSATQDYINDNAKINIMLT